MGQRNGAAWEVVQGGVKKLAGSNHGKRRS